MQHQAYQVGYQQQHVPPQAQPRMTEQQVKFYKSGLFGFSSAAGKLERDYRRMVTQGWKLTSAPSIVGTNILWQRVVVAVYER